MPRPPDNYTHAQFEPIDSDFQGETVRCMHCKQWTGSVKTLNRKKEHLLKCHAYAAWRAAGNGQDLPPPNKYSKRDSAAMQDDPNSSPYYADANFGGSQYTPNMARNGRPLDLTKLYDEFWDDSTNQKHNEDMLAAFIRNFEEQVAETDYDQVIALIYYYVNAPKLMHFVDLFRGQCMRTRCKYCGAARAKNSTRQVEHLQQCHEFLNSTEGQAALADGSLQLPNEDNGDQQRRDIWKGGAPNPNLNVNVKRGQWGPRPNQKATQRTPTAATKKPAPSLVNHLLLQNRDKIEAATQQPFLSHAGCGTLSSTALETWLTQYGHMSRSLTTFIGTLIGKLRLTDTNKPQYDSAWRTLDLLVSSLNNAKRELEFLRTTQQKYGLHPERELPKHATKGFIDLFASVSSPSAGLLEGMVVLWTVQYLYNASWQYGSTFIQTGPPSSTAYSLPSFLQQTGNQYDMPNNNPFGGPQGNATNADGTHTAALREALIPNWTSSGFGKFVEACKAIVDELANGQTTGNGKAELDACSTTFEQAIWLWKMMWPEVDGMGREKEAMQADEEEEQANGGADGESIEIQDDDENAAGRDEDAPADSPYGGTGLGAIAAANRVT